VYDKALTGLGPAAGFGVLLPHTGLAVSLVWVFLAAFALLAAGLAFIRVVPRRHG